MADQVIVSAQHQMSWAWKPETNTALMHHTMAMEKHWQLLVSKVGERKRLSIDSACYCTLYCIYYPTADNDFLAFPVWLVEVKSSKNTFFLFSWRLLWYSCPEKHKTSFLYHCFSKTRSFSFYNPSILTSPNPAQKQNFVLSSRLLPELQTQLIYLSWLLLTPNHSAQIYSPHPLCPSRHVLSHLYGLCSTCQCAIPTLLPPEEVWDMAQK